MGRDVTLTRIEDAPSAIRVEVLHQFRVMVAGRNIVLPEGAERLTAYLALEDRPRARQSLAGTLWPERDSSEAAAILRRALWRLNRDTPGLVHRGGQHLSLAGPVDVDVRELCRLAEAVTADLAGTYGVRPAALRLLEGDLLPDWSFEWLDGRRELLRQMRLHTLEAIARKYLDSARPEPALTVALAAVGIDPLRESAHRIVIQAHLAEGNNAEALRQYTHYRKLLREELQLRPGPQMQALLAQVGSPAVPTLLNRRVRK